MGRHRQCVFPALTVFAVRACIVRGASRSRMGCTRGAPQRSYVHKQLTRALVEWHQLLGFSAAAALLVVRCMLTRYYPIAGNDKGSHADTAASWSDTRRPIDRARGEVGEWLLVDGVRIFGLQTPSTCTNIGIFAAHALLGEDERIDLVISGPNLGRNTGSAFCVSSGTVGAALSGALCGCKGISISFGHFVTAPPSLLPGRTEPLTPDEQTLARKRALAHSVSLVQQLWNKWDQNTQVYTINVPLCDTLEVPEVRWTRIWQSKHGPVRPALLTRFTACHAKPGSLARTSTLHRTCPRRCGLPAMQSSNRTLTCGQCAPDASACRRCLRPLRSRTCLRRSCP